MKRRCARKGRGGTNQQAGQHKVHKAQSRARCSERREVRHSDADPWALECSVVVSNPLAPRHATPLPVQPRTFGAPRCHVCHYFTAPGANSPRQRKKLGPTRAWRIRNEIFNAFFRLSSAVLVRRETLPRARRPRDDGRLLLFIELDRLSSSFSPFSPTVLS